MKRTKRVVVSLTPEEFVRFDKARKLLGFGTVAKFLREAALDLFEKSDVSIDAGE